MREHGDTKNNKPDLRIERYLSGEATLTTGKKARGCITVKHSLSSGGRYIYALEVMDTKNAFEKTRAKGRQPSGEPNG